jgi:hypothetical protein
LPVRSGAQIGSPAACPEKRCDSPLHMPLAPLLDLPGHSRGTMKSMAEKPTSHPANLHFAPQKPHLVAIRAQLAGPLDTVGTSELNKQQNKHLTYHRKEAK